MILPAKIRISRSFIIRGFKGTGVNRVCHLLKRGSSETFTQSLCVDIFDKSRYLEMCTFLIYLEIQRCAHFGYIQRSKEVHIFHISRDLEMCTFFIYLEIQRCAHFGYMQRSKEVHIFDISRDLEMCSFLIYLDVHIFDISRDLEMCTFLIYLEIQRCAHF